LTRAWRITWNNKALWLFGLLASCGRGNGSSGGGGDGGGGGDFDFQDPGQMPPQVKEFVRQMTRPEVIGIIITVACVLLLLVLLFIALSIIGEAGLIGGVRLADDNGKVALSEAWEVGTRYFWPMLGSRLLLLVPVLILLVIGGGVGLIAPVALVCLLPLLCVFIPGMIVLSIVQLLASRTIVLEGSGVLDAYRSGWELLKANVGPVIVFGIILFFITLLVGFVMFIPLVIVIVPFVLAFVADQGNTNLMLLISGGLDFLCVLPILMLISSITTTWDSAVWTLAYKLFVGKRSGPPLAPPSPYMPA
jgi:hypothetical protein